MATARYRWKGLCLAGLCLAALCAGTGYGQEASQPGAVSKDDLVKLAAAGLDDSVVISLIQGADRVPKLSADDVIALQQAGVSLHVITAVIQRATALGARSGGEPPSHTQRRIRVDASMTQRKSSFWKLGRGSEKVDKAEVSWGLRGVGWENLSTLRLDSSAGCPHDDICVKRDYQSGQCTDVASAMSEAWLTRYSCFRADRITALSDTPNVFDIELPVAAAYVELRPFFRNGEGAAQAWITRHAAEQRGERVPGYVKLNLWGSRDIDVRLQVELEIAPDGLVQDMQVAECEVINRDEASLERRAHADSVAYCEVVWVKP